jgi:Sigma-70, region 4
MELPDRERRILALYYEEELTMAEIGVIIGVCESRVSQLRSLALSRLRESLRESLGRAVPSPIAESVRRRGLPWRTRHPVRSLMKAA